MPSGDFRIVSDTLVSYANGIKIAGRYMAGKPEMTCAVTSRHAAYNVTVRTTARTAQIDWFPAYDSGLYQRYIVWLVTRSSAINYSRHFKP